MYISNVNLWNAEIISGNIKIYHITVIIITIAKTIIIINIDNIDNITNQFLVDYIPLNNSIPDDLIKI